MDTGKPKTSRKSTVIEETREPTPPAKKRSRPKKADQEERSEKAQEATSDDDEARAKKKPRKSQGASAKKITKQVADDEEVVTFGSMKKHMTIASWENLVETIDTIERGDEGDLYVYFKMSVDISCLRFLNAKYIYRKHSDVRMREVSRLCAQKFPQKVCCKNLASWTTYYSLDLLSSSSSMSPICDGELTAKMRINTVRHSGIQSGFLVLFCSLLYLISYIPNMTELVNRDLLQVHMSKINGICHTFPRHSGSGHYVNVGLVYFIRVIPASPANDRSAQHCPRVSGSILSRWGRIINNIQLSLS